MPAEPQNSSPTSSSSSEPGKKPRKPRGIIASYRLPEHKPKLIDRDVTEAEVTAKDNAQGAAQSTAKTERRTADKLLADIVAGRLDIQLAADKEWPWTTREHDVIRAQFKLPLTRPMTE